MPEASGSKNNPNPPQNGAENGAKNKPPEGKKFSSEYQPSPDAKRKGWTKKKMAQEFMDDVVKYMNLTRKEYEALDQSALSRGELMALKYVELALEDPKMLAHFIDKHVPTATSIDITSDGETISGYSFEIIDKTKDVDKEETKDSGIQTA